MSGHPNSIQPETTLSLTASADVMREPDIAFINTGVQSEASSAKEAMAQNRAAMNGVFDALKTAGVEDRDMQTSNFQIYPQYDYLTERTENGERGRQVLRGYQVSNQLTVKVRDLDQLGTLLDALVDAGGNQFSGINFALDDDREARDEARVAAVKAVTERAALMAGAAGYQVGRIVTMSETIQYGGPQPRMMAARAFDAAESAPTPIASGEVGFTATVSVTFELTR